jgi:hypothetical protein
MPQTKTSRASSSGASRSSNARSKRTQASRRSKARPSTNGIVDKAKMPLVAGGAALAGLAGGAALAARKRRVGMLPRVRNGGAAAKALGTAAKEVARTGYRVGELTAEVRRTREQLAKK